MKKLNILWLATVFAATTFANDGAEIPNKASTPEKNGFVDVMPKSLEGVDLMNAEVVVTTAVNAFINCDIEVAAYLDYIDPALKNPQEIREKTKAKMKKSCAKISSELKKMGNVNVKVLNIAYEGEDKAEVQFQVNDKLKNSGTLYKMPNGWRMK